MGIRCTIVVLCLNLLACASGEVRKELSNSDRARMLVSVANGSLVEGDSTSALQSLVEAEKLDPSLPELHHTKALVFVAKQDRTTAITAAKIALELKPDFAEASNTLGRLLLDQNRTEEGIPYLLKAAKNPLYREAYKPWTSLGILEYRRGNLARAKEYMDLAIGSSPQFACFAYYYRGHIELKESRFRNAIQDYERASQKFCSNFADAHFAAGIAYEQSRQYEKAKKKFLEVKQRFATSEFAEQAVQHLRSLP